MDRLRPIVIGTYGIRYPCAETWLRHTMPNNPPITNRFGISVRASGQRLGLKMEDFCQKGLSESYSWENTVNGVDTRIREWSMMIQIVYIHLPSASDLKLDWDCCLNPQIARDIECEWDEWSRLCQTLTVLAGTKLVRGSYWAATRISDIGQVSSSAKQRACKTVANVVKKMGVLICRKPVLVEPDRHSSMHAKACRLRVIPARCTARLHTRSPTLIPKIHHIFKYI